MIWWHRLPDWVVGITIVVAFTALLFLPFWLFILIWELGNG